MVARFPPREGASTRPSHRLTPELQQAWRQVTKHPPFPILAETREALRQAFNRRLVSHAQLEPIVESDPALCWHLANTATQKNPNCREQLSGAINCLSLLGMQQSVAIAKRLDTVSADESAPHRRYYRQALLTGRFAGLLSRELCQGMTSDRHIHQQYYWATLMAQSSIWPWWLTYDGMPRWLMRVAAGQDPWHGILQLLGKDWALWKQLPRRGILPDLGLALFEPSNHLNFAEWKSIRRKNPRTLPRHQRRSQLHPSQLHPSQSRPSISSRAGKNSTSHPVDPRQILHKCHSGSLVILCATMLAWLCYLRPDGQRMRRWLVLTANVTGERLPQVLARVRQVQRRLNQSPQYYQTVGWDLCAGSEPLRRSLSLDLGTPAPK